MSRLKEMRMFKNVLVGVDGRSGGRDGIALASRLKEADGRLTLAHVRRGMLRRSHAVTPGMEGEGREAAASLLEEERDATGVDATLVSIEAFTPGRGLHEQAEDQGADLLVVGSTTRGAWGRAMLGDDTRAALNGTPCAVAVAPLGYAASSSSLAKIGVAYDDSRESVAALEAARGIAASTGAVIKALQVVEIPSVAYAGAFAPGAAIEIESIMDEVNEQMHELRGVEGRAVYGLAGEELARFGQEVDLLVVGSRGYGPLMRLVLGSTSDFLQRHARCPLLVLPRAAVKPGDDQRSADSALGVPA
jgi:nucleotide-binding universal stress UspA family protein